MTVEAYYALTPNYDNSQDTLWPLGNKPNTIVPEVPSNFRSHDETDSTILLYWDHDTFNHSGFEIQQWIFGVDTSWRQVAAPGASERQYLASGLPASTHIGHRIRATGSGDPSAWAPEVWVDTDAIPAVGGTDLLKIRWQADWSHETDTSRGALTGGDTEYGMTWLKEAQVDEVELFNGRKTFREDLDVNRTNAAGEIEGCGYGRSFYDVPAENGTEMWHRVWMKHDIGFEFTTNPGTRKWFRQRERTTGGASQGYADFNIECGSGNGPWETAMFNKEGIGMGWLDMDPNGAGNSAPVRGQWECYEQYVKSHDTDGIVRWWKNGVLMGEYTGIRTKVGANNRMDGVFFINIWNADPPKNQTWWWVAPAVAVRNSERDDTPHMDRDAAGNSFIGLNTAYVTDPAEGLIFADDFSSYSIGDKLVSVKPPVAVNGVEWWHTASGNAPTIVAGGYDGDAQALGFDFKIRNDGAADYAYSEQRFKLCDSVENAVGEVWIEYYVYWPSDYEPTIASHNKTMFLTSTQFGNTNGVQHYGGDMWSSNESWMAGDLSMTTLTQNVHKGKSDGGIANWGHANEDWASTPAASFGGSNYYNPINAENQDRAFWRLSDNGNWRRYRYHVKPASASGYDALCRVWKENTLITEVKDSNWKDDNGVLWDSGYLFGWQSCSVAKNCVVKLSRFKIYTQDPNWSFS